MLQVVERTRGAVGYGGKPKFPHECAARVGNRGWSPINHRPESFFLTCSMASFLQANSGREKGRLQNTGSTGKE